LLEKVLVQRHTATASATPSMVRQTQPPYSRDVKNRALHGERAHPDGYAINTSAVFQHYSTGNALLISSQQTNTNNRTYSSLFSNMVGKEQLGVECRLPRHCRRGGSAEARTGKHELARARRSPGWRSKAAIQLGPRPSSLPPEPMPSIRLISKLRSPDDACTSTTLSG
jgi:hypothetical protein